MQISSRFTIAIHILLCIDEFKDAKVTSEFLSSSTNVNPVIVRNILGMLKDKGYISINRGVGGAKITKDLNEISLLDIYKAVDCIENDLFSFHNDPNPLCPVGSNIHNVLDDKIKEVQQVMENKLASISLLDLRLDLNKYIK